MPSGFPWGPGGIPLDSVIDKTLFDPDDVVAMWDKYEHSKGLSAFTVSDENPAGAGIAWEVTATDGDGNSYHWSAERGATPEEREESLREWLEEIGYDGGNEWDALRVHADHAFEYEERL